MEVLNEVHLLRSQGTALKLKEERKTKKRDLLRELFVEDNLAM